MKQAYYDKHGTASSFVPSPERRVSKRGLIYPVTRLACGIAASSIPCKAGPEPHENLPVWLHAAQKSSSNTASEFLKSRSNRFVSKTRPIGFEPSNSLSELEAPSVAAAVEMALIEHGAPPDRQITTDDSTVFEFFGEYANAMVDVYDDGEIVLIIHSDTVRDCYEATLDQVELIARRLKDGGF